MMGQGYSISLFDGSPKQLGCYPCCPPGFWRLFHIFIKCFLPLLNIFETSISRDPDRVIIVETMVNSVYEIHTLHAGPCAGHGYNTRASHGPTSGTCSPQLLTSSVLPFWPQRSCIYLPNKKDYLIHLCLGILLDTKGERSKR